ncbi:MAG: RNA methyltransferase [Candidatus Methanoliparum thermophilum]|uniref:RNA methyltransferase n=1 Tax=Methanoliparum thermophilum TaxID=2491083 RepID=A0A520KTI9_METT2|nr:RNA methyltransferase [Candidatus Methanoliparum sp. LAM-1]RZN65404.1 MAG: RNA methyltransferase [Candidatus Methanoliparum thermophilum]BDC35507.1 RNA methyltransferase [Candidatus Methanoliparum sp. LAM-1]
MVYIRIVLVEPRYAGNIGSIARIMKNFGFNDLILIKPPVINLESKKMAMHASDILENAKIYDSINDVIDNSDYVIGTTSVVGGRSNVRRLYITPKDLKTILKYKKDIVSILFGREDNGLSNEELKLCDAVLNIPSSSDYLALNLAQSVGIILYELYTSEKNVINKKYFPDRNDLIYFEEHLLRLLYRINFPKTDKEKTVLMIKRILATAGVGSREIKHIRGILSAIEKKIDEKEE